MATVESELSDKLQKRRNGEELFESITVKSRADVSSAHLHLPDKLDRHPRQYGSGATTIYESAASRSIADSRYCDEPIAPIRAHGFQEKLDALRTREASPGNLVGRRKTDKFPARGRLGTDVEHSKLSSDEDEEDQIQAGARAAQRRRRARACTEGVVEHQGLDGCFDDQERPREPQGEDTKDMGRSSSWRASTAPEATQLDLLSFMWLHAEDALCTCRRRFASQP